MSQKITVLDIETETVPNRDFVEGTKRILSVQLGNDQNHELYYDGNEDNNYTLDKVKNRIDDILSNNGIFTGYNIVGFDLPILKKFLDVVIPEDNYIDLYDIILGLKELNTEIKRQFNSLKLYHVCTALGINCNHKKKMDDKVAENKGDFRKVIVSSFEEFVISKGSKNTFFYEYAIGDVISEYQLYQFLDKNRKSII